MKKIIIIIISFFLLWLLISLIEQVEVKQKINQFTSSATYVKTQDGIEYYEVDTNNQTNYNYHHTEPIGQPGDVITIPVPNYQSKIAKFLMTVMSGAHSAIIVENNQLVEAPGFAETKVVKSENLFDNHPEEIIIVSEASLTEAELATILTNAESKVGTSYDYLFSKRNGEAYYCSELVWSIYQEVGINLDDDYFFVTPNDILLSDSLQIKYVEIKNGDQHQIYYKD